MKSKKEFGHLLFPEKEFKENKLLELLRVGMNEPLNAKFVSEAIKEKMLESARWGFEQAEKQFETVKGLMNKALELEHKQQAERDVKLRKIFDDAIKVTEGAKDNEEFKRGWIFCASYLKQRALVLLDKNEVGIK